MSELEWKRKPRARIETFEAIADDGGRYCIEWWGRDHGFEVSYQPLFERYKHSVGSAPNLPAALALVESYAGRKRAWEDSWADEMRQRKAER
jgi:hypothetical protein